jgi:pyridoxine 5-phosphate synthase
MHLGINIDHIATLREARKENFPSIPQAAQVALASGADSITIHLREDRRHIQDYDLQDLKFVEKLNLEIASEDDMIEIATKLAPWAVCIVPEKRQEITTEGGLNIVDRFERIRGHIDRLKTKPIIVSVFIEADKAQIEAAKAAGANAIEIHTGAYARSGDGILELQKIQEAAAYAHSLGLKVHAGHGLDYENVLAIAKIPQITELNIGFSIVANALFIGLGPAVKQMKTLLN